MRPVQSLSATVTFAVLLMALPWAPGAAQDAAKILMAQAPASPSASGWSAPGASPSQAATPPTSGWSTPGAAEPRPAAAPPSAGWSTPGAAAGAQRDCGGEFIPLRQDAEKKAAAIRAIAQRKQQAELCAAFKVFALAEAKTVKYIEEHGAECRVPPDALKTMKGNHAKTIEVRNKICSAPTAAAPRPPSLSDALGTSRIPQAPTDGAPAKKGSAFETMTGNPLAR